jgi:cytochrome c oxidase assembly protein subunit 15
VHQAGAALVLATATLNLWLVRRSQARLFTSGSRARGL